MPDLTINVDLQAGNSCTALYDHAHTHLEPVHNIQKDAAVFPEAQWIQALKILFLREFFILFLKHFNHSPTQLRYCFQVSISPLTVKTQYPQTGKDI